MRRRADGMPIFTAEDFTDGTAVAWFQAHEGEVIIEMDPPEPRKEQMAPFAHTPDPDPAWSMRPETEPDAHLEQSYDDRFGTDDEIIYDYEDWAAQHDDEPSPYLGTYSEE